MVLLRRLLLLFSIIGAGASGYVWWQRRADPGDQVPEWPAFPDAGVGEAAQTWVAPVDGVCPTGHPVKLNESSGIFHVPGGRFYDRTKPDRCYASTDDAAADGYRAAKA
ncbi:MAG: hypothetical protein WD225_11425 [Ilumatobacteraceae bacterium]